MKHFLALSLLLAVSIPLNTAFAGEGPLAVAVAASEALESRSVPAPEALKNLSSAPDETLPVVTGEGLPQAEAMFKEALKHHDSGRWKNAYDKALEIIARWPGSAWEGRAAMLAGRASAKLGELDAAQGLFAVARARMPYLEDHMDNILAGAYAGRGSNTGAAALYLGVADKYPDGPLADEALLKAAQALADAGNRAEAVPVLRRLLDRKPGPETTAKALLLTASASVKLGDTAGALRAYDTLWREHPWTTQASKAEGLLKDAKAELPVRSADDYTRRGDAYARKAMHGQAAAAYAAALPLLPEGAPPSGALLLKLGKAYYNLKENSLAERYLTAAVALDRGAGPEGYYLLARTYLRTGDEARYRDAVLLCAVNFPEDPRAVDCLYMLGTTMSQDGEHEAALGIFDWLRGIAPKSERLDEVLWQTGWAYFKKGDYPSAKQAFATLADGYPGSTLAPQGLYWEARSLESLGDLPGSQAVFCELRERYPYSFYSLFPGTAYMPDAETRPVPAVLAYPDAGCGSYTDTRLARAFELGMQGMRQAAVRELRRAEAAYGGTLSGIKTLAGLYAFLGEPRRLMDLAGRLYERPLKVGTDGIPGEGLEFMFPLGSWDVIGRESARWGLDPMLAAGIIREESRFNPGAVSPAGAVGLMQIMPGTAKAVCRKMGVSFSSANQLLDEGFNVPVGLCYLESLVEKHEGNLVRSLAEYNAGPGALARWKEKNPGVSEDVFIESIDYKETRGYVKKVLRNYYMYRKLYGTEGGQTPPPALEASGGLPEPAPAGIEAHRLQDVDQPLVDGREPQLVVEDP